MRPIVRIVAVALATGLVIKLLKRLRYVVGHQVPVEIRVTIRESAKGAEIVVDKHPAYVRRGQSVRWTHRTGRLIIEPKEEAGRRWPFSNQRPNGINGQPAHSGRMLREAELDVPHSYGIEVRTTRWGTLHLDPDIIIHV